MGMVAGFFAGLIAAIALFVSALGGVFFRLLSSEDDFDAEDPADVMRPPPLPREV